MNRMFLAVVPLLLSPALALGDVDPQPRAPNIVTKLLDEYLDPLFRELTANNLSLPLVDLESAGNFSDLKGCVLGLSKHLDGIRSHGFKMNLNATTILLGGKYNIVHLDILDLFPVFGKGDFSVSVELINLKMTLNAVRNNKTKQFDITLPEFIIQVENPKVKFENLMNDLHLANFLNELISNLIPPLMEMISSLVKKISLLILDVFGNRIFDCLDIESKEERQECLQNVFVTQTDVLKEMVAYFVEELKNRV